MKESRRKNEPELYGASEAAEVLGVAQSNLRRIPTLPEPYQRLSLGTLWRAKDIDALAQKRREERDA